MKRIIFNAVTILLYFQSFSPSITFSEETNIRGFLISANQVGNMRPGMAIDEIHGIYGAESIKKYARRKDGEGKLSSLQVFFEGPQKHIASLEVFLDEEKEKIVKSVAIYDKRFKTAEGIGVGSTLGEIRKNYKDFTLENFMESDQVWVVFDDKGWSFKLDLSYFDEPLLDSDNTHKWKKEPNLVPDDAAIQIIYIR